MTNSKILIAGIGNMFFGDDAFGVEVVKRLIDHNLPESTQIVDFGIRGLDLAYALMESYAAVILIDATSRGGEPGSLYVFEPDLRQPEKHDVESLPIEAHGMVPERVLRWVQMTMGLIPSVKIVGCEPAMLGDWEDMTVGLSPVVTDAIPKAVEIILSLVDEILCHDNLQQA